MPQVERSPLPRVSSTGQGRVPDPTTGTDHSPSSESRRRTSLSPPETTRPDVNGSAKQTTKPDAPPRRRGPHSIGAAFVLLLVLGAAAHAETMAFASPSDPDSGVRDLGRDLSDDRASDARGANVLNEDTGLGYASIAAALAAASAGDSLVVQADVLVEGLVDIDRTIGLRGATGSEVVQAGVDTGDSGDGRGWFLVRRGAQAVISDLSFAGDGRQVYQAFRIRGTATLQDVDVSTIRFGTYQGSAIVAFGDGPVSVVGCRFQDIGRIGVLLFGSTVAGSVVNDNVFFGKGAGDHLDYGLEISAGATATVTGNWFSAARGVAAVDDSVSGAILVTTTFGAGTSVTATANQFVDNSFGILSNSGDESTIVAHFNRFFGNDAGLLHGSGTPPDLTNNWWSCNGGPQDPLCDLVRDRAGAAQALFDPWLVLSLALSPSSTEVGDQIGALADLTFDSNLADVSGLGAVADGILVGFEAGPLGLAVPGEAATNSGVAATAVDIVAVGAGQVTASLDHQTVTSDFSAFYAVPIHGAVGGALLVLSLLITGLLVLRS